MVLVDTSVWIDDLRNGNKRLRNFLLDEEVVCHPFIVGELACGCLKNRAEILSLLRALPSARKAEDGEILLFIERCNLAGQGIGLVDVHLLASARLTGISLWTLDARLARVAVNLGLGLA